MSRNHLNSDAFRREEAAMDRRLEAEAALRNTDLLMRLEAYADPEDGGVRSVIAEAVVVLRKLETDLNAATTKAEGPGPCPHCGSNLHGVS